MAHQPGAAGRAPAAAKIAIEICEQEPSATSQLQLRQAGEFLLAAPTSPQSATRDD
ncbi:MAG: hypothetical protein R3C19_02140 [Planctomycetaceae bacterium]